MRILVALLLFAGIAQADRLGALSVLTDAYPRAFYFRQSEGLAANPKLDYEAWEAQFSALDGIMGKCLDEEIPNRSQRNIAFFSRYKERHPDKAVLLHFNGNSRDSRFEADGYFAGHWLYLNGCRLVEALDAAAGTSTVKVEDPSLFKTDMGRYDDKNEDLGICMLDGQGRLNWSQAEQVELIGVDAAAKTITIRRGAFGTKPLAFPKGQGYVAAHVTEGPWGNNSNLLWAYNLATTCPRDASGRTCTDLLLDDLVRWFGEDGPLAAFDGIEFDVLHFRAHGGGRGRTADVDADGEGDAGMVGGANAYGLGVHQFVARLRAALGPDRLITADGHSIHNQRSTRLLNGIESEGWPTLMDPTLADWSGGLNRHLFWRDRAQRPQLDYINHKFMEQGKPISVPHAITRLVLAAACFTDSAFTYSMLPPAEQRGDIEVWDELCMGQAARDRWLGKALGPTLRLGFEAPDLLEGAGVTASPEFVARWRSEDGVVTQGEQGICIAGKGPDQAQAVAVLPGIQVSGEDLLVRFEVRAEPMRGYPAELPRLVWVSCIDPCRLIRPRLPEISIQLRGQEEHPAATGTGDVMFGHRPSTVIGGETHESYIAHPPFGRDRGPGATIWQRAATVPKGGGVLHFYTGLSPAPHPSDGVTFRVELDNGGERTVLFDTHQQEFAWVARQVELGAWAGKTVTLRFVTDCGPDDNTVADHAHWGDVYVAEAGEAPPRVPTAGRLMTWADSDPFEASFYFRDAGPATLDLEIETESAEPVHITGLRVCGAADTMARAYEGGLVLANPSSREQAFDLERLRPGAKLRRIQGTATQDPATNNGEAVGGQITLPPRDALFLVAE